VEDLGYKKGNEHYASLKFPEDLLVIHFIGAPLSGQVSKEVKGQYGNLSKMGPNDGLTTLVDEIISQGMVITEGGLDHYYRDPEIDKKAIALLLYVSVFYNPYMR